jgi:hypothetical protein
MLIKKAIIVIILNFMILAFGFKNRVAVYPSLLTLLVKIKIND